MAALACWSIVSAHAECNANATFNLPNAAAKVNAAGFASAIDAATAYFNQDPGQCPLTDFTIKIAGGTYDFSSDTTPGRHGGLIEFRSINPPAVTKANGTSQLHLVIEGAGSGALTTGLAPGSGRGSTYIAGQAWVDGPNQTTLITNKNARTFFGNGSSHIVIQGMTLMQSYPTTSQGIVSFPLGTEPPGQVTVDIQPGYAPPTVEYVDCHGNATFQAVTAGCTYADGATNPFSARNFLDGASQNAARLMRVYDNTNPLDPVLAQTRTNVQIEWGARGEHGSGWRPSKQPDPQNYPNRWTIYLNPGKVLSADYVQGALVCIKSKQGGYLAAEFIGPGSDILFNDIRWIGDGESAFLGTNPDHPGMTGIRVLNSENVRPNAVNGQKQCLASSYGGLQMGGPRASNATGGNVIDNYFAEGTGDDAVAFFHDQPTHSLKASYVSNSTINDSFARSVFSLRSSVSNASEQNRNVAASTCNAILLDRAKNGIGCPVTSMQ